MDTGDAAWVLMSAALVLFMTPGLALFYGGMDRSRNVLNMLMMNFWCLLDRAGRVGDRSASRWPRCRSATTSSAASTPSSCGASGSSVTAAPASRSIVFLGMFAVITPALISGAVADRMKFSAWAIFVPAVAPARVLPGVQVGLRRLARPAGLARLRRRHRHPRQRRHRRAGRGARARQAQGLAEPKVTRRTRCRSSCSAPASSGSAGSASTPAPRWPPTAQPIQAFMNTFLAAAAAGLAWAVVERIRDGHFTNLGAASGHRRRPRGHHPGAGFVAGMAPIFIGLAAGVICCFAVGLKTKAGYDDALDVVGVHFVGGLVGSLAHRLLRRPRVLRRRTSRRGLFYGGGLRAPRWSRRSPTASRSSTRSSSRPSS